jgi:hypothetical protein
MTYKPHARLHRATGSEQASSHKIQQLINHFFWHLADFLAYYPRVVPEAA